MSGRDWDPSRREAVRVLWAAGWRPRALMALFPGLTRDTARHWGIWPAPKLESKARIHGTVWKLVEAKWDRKRIAEHLQIPRIRVDRIVDANPGRREPYSRRKPRKSARSAAPAVVVEAIAEKAEGA